MSKFWAIFLISGIIKDTISVTLLGELGTGFAVIFAYDVVREGDSLVAYSLASGKLHLFTILYLIIAY